MGIHDSRWKGLLLVRLVGIGISCDRNDRNGNVVPEIRRMAEAEKRRSEIMTKILDVENLTAQMPTEKGTMHIINDVSFHVDEEECFGIIGESGCGKTMTAMTVLRYSDHMGLEVTGGSIHFRDEDVLAMTKEDLKEYNGRKAAIILQDPMTALDPLYTVKNQMMETIVQQRDVSRQEAETIMKDTAAQLSITEEKLDRYPHELSGGMLQRIIGAIVISSRPQLVIADEPTTALDVTIQMQYLRMLKRMQLKNHTSIIFISHDIKVISMMCERIAVMYAGEILETASSKELFKVPAHPYTKALFNAASPGGVIRDRYETIEGAPPDLHEEIQGCPFAPRCPYADPLCRREKPGKTKLSEDHFVRCWRCADE